MPLGHGQRGSYCYGLPSCDHDHDAVYLSPGGDMNLMERWSACVASVDCDQPVMGVAGSAATAIHLPRIPSAVGDGVPLFLASTRLLV
jgi:hypothetical protein